MIKPSSRSRTNRSIYLCDCIDFPNLSRFFFSALQLVDKRTAGEGVNYLNSNPWYWNVLADDPTDGELVRALQKMFDTQGAQ